MNHFFSISIGEIRKLLGFGIAYIQAAYDEIEWSTHPDNSEGFLPRPSVVLKLAADAARESGLRRDWRLAQRIPEPGEAVISLSMPWDPESPKWPADDPALQG